MLFSPKEKGQGLAEYAIILVLVAVVVIAVIAAILIWVIIPLLKPAICGKG